MERWLPVVGWDGFYEVSDLGRVKSVERVVVRRNGRPASVRERVLLPWVSSCGYPNVELRSPIKSSTFQVHRLVLEAFVGPCPEGMECRHLDGNRLNASLENLKWGTRQENMDDRRLHGRYIGLKGEKHGMSKLSDAQVVEIRDIVASGANKAEVANRYGVSRNRIYALCRAGDQ